ncbi:hypothetical protein SS50377_27503 [Spironucleus salmonicida]|uniref:Uncharacterized protein n=1 Tax=Spironucleus salmonicida TaxID=348837 RepID=V6M155_9EUKA|nr:hypothetical protein SS50377_27503 [Spironucleus salmonicida]|eukprot:EST46904.1 Hypothetical protein SS50377_13057 [Spironucleus salmonicida]
MALVAFTEQPTFLIATPENIAAISNHKIHFISSQFSSIETPPLQPICLDFIQDSVLAYGTKTGGIGIFDYRNSVHNLFTPANLRYQTYLIKANSNTLWAACDQNENSVAMFDLRNMQQPLQVSDVVTDKIVSFVQKENGHVICVSDNGDYTEFNCFGDFVSRKICQSSKRLIQTCYNMKNEYFISLFDESVVVHDMDNVYDEIINEGAVYENVFFANTNQTVFVSNEMISICSDKCDEIYTIDARNSLACQFKNGFLWCQNGELFYEDVNSKKE